MPTLRERQAEQVRHEIRARFIRLIVERGPHGFTLNDVAAEAGLSIRTLYRHYPSRDAIIDAIMNREVKALDQELLRKAGSLTNFDQDPELVASTFEVLDAHADLLRAGRALGVTDYDGRTSEERTALVQRVVAETAGISPAAAAQLAGLVRLLLGSEAWARLRAADIDLDAREAGYAVHWAVQILMAAAVGIDGPLRPRVISAKEHGDSRSSSCRREDSTIPEDGIECADPVDESVAASAAPAMTTAPEASAPPVASAASEASTTAG